MRHDLKVAAVCFALAFAMWLAKPALAGEPPTPEPPQWDKSSIGVTGACVEGVPNFIIKNDGSGDMAGPSAYWLLAGAGGANTCAATTTGIIPSGYFQLKAGEKTTIVWTDHGDAPFHICVEQRIGHPGEGWAAAGLAPDDQCVTAEAEVDESTVRGISFLFIPALKR